MTGLAAASSKTVEGIAREVLPAQSERALNKFFTEYDWEPEQVNHERLDELQNHGETRWSQDGYIIIDDSVNQKTGEELPGAGQFYDHAEGETVWGQNLVYAFYADDKTAYPLTVRQYEHHDDENEAEAETKYQLARKIITELEEEVGVPADTYLFDAWFDHDSALIDHVESDNTDWVGPFRSNRHVIYDNDEMRVDALAERIDMQARDVDDETYKIWTKKLPVSHLGETRVLIAEKVTDVEDQANPVKYLATNKIDAPSAHVIRTYSYRRRIEMFFEDSKEDLGLGDCERRDDDGASRHWHLQMLAYSLLRLGYDSSASASLTAQASSLLAELEYSLKEVVYNVFSWVRDHPE